jgi:hypothetical protein
MAEPLGYGSPARHDAFHQQIAELESRIGRNEETAALLSRLRDSLAGLDDSSVDQSNRVG